ncbi:probable bifunctional dTTP/UTP pyrophosphatase/methyltransferase protein isoform X4 [Ovis aries]|uniref:probable bifunctional dTTP/UTP pyrophosphatase/methyltransferase protein isoform X4 n=1 Tax=Ovis aries TaxID=9940 RepID=UPI00295264BA|nr:probable bifunctional dTTP/UTP pyrophosphatase/methyltransferase protein isoform X4 [Ovis aries]
MLLRPVIGKLQHKRVVLASSSPRRREILSNAGLRFEVVPSRFKEKLHKGSFAAPHAYAVETAKQKALEVADRMHQARAPFLGLLPAGCPQKDLRAPDVVIGADTIVSAAGAEQLAEQKQLSVAFLSQAVGGLILEKPVDKQDAYRMLLRLSGKEHSVFTGVAIVHCCTRDGQLDTEVSEFYEETTVKFSELSEELLWEYIDSGEPMDKAGGYGIQALGGMLVEYVRGDFLNVVGFPLNRFCKELARLYHAPRAPGTPRPVQHDSIPAVDTFEDLSDSKGGGSDPARASGGVQAGGARPQAPRTQEADLNGVTDSQPGLPAGLLELMDGFKASKVLLTACKLQVFDVLKDRGPLSATDVAREIDASVGGTARLLDVCAALGLLDKSDRGYSNTETASLHLASDGEQSLHGLAAYHDGPIWGAFTHLGRAVREGAAWTPEPLLQGPHKWSTEATLQFMRASHGLSKLTAQHVATAFDLSPFTSACHLGGCTGALAHKLVQEYPRLQVTVFDLPEVIKLAGDFQTDAQLSERVHFVPGDLSSDSLPPADLYIFCSLLHDWPDDRLHGLLSRISGSCKPGAGLLLAELAPAEEEEEEASGAARRPPGLRTRGVGRRPRSPGQYRRLLQRLGFQDVRAARAGGLLHVVLGTRAPP